MAFTLKPADLETAKTAADIQKKSKADLKSSVGKTGVKFIAAKNCVIGGKKVDLFIVTDKPLAFETVLKARHPAAYRAKGTCDVLKDPTTKGTRVSIKTSAGQMAPDVVAKLVKAAVLSDKSIVAEFAPAKPTSPPTLTKTVKFDAGGVPKWARDEFNQAPAKIVTRPPLNKTEKPKEGVPDWAKEEYRRNSKRTLMASMTPDGKIGSVYFSDGSRIRTTHGAGPSRETHQGQKSVQFNINDAAALKVFKKDAPQEYASPKMWDYYDAWLVKKLANVTVTTAPTWATVIERPDDAHDLSTGTPSDDIKLFEIFKKVNGDVESWHPSRGTGVKFETDKQTLSVLRAGIKHIDSLGLKNPGERNTAFYAFVKSRLPQSQIVKAMRDPSTV